jgi:hypothetical protein
MFVRITQRIPAPNCIASDNSDPSQHCSQPTDKGSTNVFR